MAIEIVDFPIKNSDFPVRYVTNYQRVREYPHNSDGQKYGKAKMGHYGTSNPPIC